MRIEGSGVNPGLLVDRATTQLNGGPNFSELLAKGLEQVHLLQSDADGAAWRLAAGATDNLHDVMIAMERASIALELTIAIRNKLVEAYQEIMRMQV